MRKLSVLFGLFMFLGFVSCDENVKKSYYKNGALESELHYHDGKLNGESCWYDSLGQMVKKATYEDDVLEGHLLSWHENGQLKEDCWYKGGKLDCVFRSFSAKGLLVSERHYCEGKLNGDYRKWYDNGQVFQEGQYADDLMDGLWLVFYPSGALASKAEYDKGTGKQVCFAESGFKCLEVSYLNNLKHGFEYCYSPDGRMTRIVEYKNGEMISENNDP